MNEWLVNDCEVQPTGESSIPSQSSESDNEVYASVSIHDSCLPVSFKFS
jgi:hypothetical protein